MHPHLSESFELRVAGPPESIRDRVREHAAASLFAWRRAGNKAFYGSVSRRGFRLLFHAGRDARRTPVIVIGRFLSEADATCVRVCVRPQRSLYAMLVILAAMLLAFLIALPRFPLGAVGFCFWVLMAWTSVATVETFLWDRPQAVETIVRVLLNTPENES